ncbi:MAG: diguanylate cyclase/phosphodiesterase, partial [Labilithrix sp.]|nr:diguanylate cyclase/phosphodiesterase [Labilithrix sp.]
TVARPAESLEQAHHRLQQLYDISKLLTSFESLRDTVPATVALVGNTLSLRTAILILNHRDEPETMALDLEGVGADQLQAARAHARKSYAYLAGARGAFIDEAPPGKFILLPLVVGRRPIFGAFQLESSRTLDETDLWFVNAVVNQLAIAIDRQMSIDAKQGAAEARSLNAEEGRLNAELRQARAERLEASAKADQREAERTRDDAWTGRDAADQKRAVAEALQERYEALVDNLDRAFVWEADARSNRISYVSARAETLLGYPRQRWLEEPDFWMSCVVAEDRPALLQTFHKALIENKNQRCDHRCMAADGRVVWLHTGLHLADGSGARPKLQGVSTDVTSAKEAEERVRGQLDFTRAVTGSLGEGVIAVDMNRRITLFNRAAQQMLGRIEDEALGKLAEEMVEIRSPDGALIPPGEGPLALAMRTGEPVRSDENFFSGRRQEAFSVSYTAAPLQGAGRASGAVLAFQDLMEIRRAEKEQRLLADVSTRLAASLDYRETLEAVAHFAVPLIADYCAIDEVDPGGVLRRVQAMFADPRKQLTLVGEASAFMPRPATPEARALACGPLLLADVTEGAIEEMAHGDDHARFIRAAGFKSMMVVPLSAGSRLLGALTLGLAESGRRYSSSDLTFAQEVAYRAALALDNARLYEQAQRATRSREDLLAVVSHDLRNPLGAILGGASLLLEQVPDDRRLRTRRIVEMVRRSAERMNRLINDLLDRASIESGRFSVEKGSQPGGALVSEAVEMQQTLAAQRSLHLETELPKNTFFVLCDRERILQVFSNLIGNAIKFTPINGRIVVRAETRESEAVFSVVDTGPGIATDDLPHVFDRYWQAKETARMGSGLGLSIAKGIIDAHGGRIWAESRVGTGSAFYFTLPLVAGPFDRARVQDAALSSESRIEPKGPSPRRLILVVDDDVDNRELVSTLLREKGYDVVTANDGAEALRCLHDVPLPSLIVLDLQMPVMDGWAFLAERNRELALRSIPVIVLSGQRREEEAAAAANVSFVHKAASGSRLVATIKQLVH